MRRLIEFAIPGEPVGKGRARSAVVTNRRTGEPLKAESGRFVLATYTPEKTRDYESTVRWFAKAAMKGRPPFEGPLRYDVQMHFKLPESWSNRQRASALAGEIWPLKKPDASNVIKAIEDAMNGIVWIDDAQVAAGSFIRIYRRVPMVLVSVDSLVPVVQPELIEAP